MGKQLGTNHSNANVFQTVKIPCIIMKTVYRNARWGCKHFLGIRILSLNEEPNLDASQWGRDLPHCGGRFLTPLWLSQQALHFIC